MHLRNLLRRTRTLLALVAVAGLALAVGGSVASAARPARKSPKRHARCHMAGRGRHRHRVCRHVRRRKHHAPGRTTHPGGTTPAPPAPGGSTGTTPSPTGLAATKVIYDSGGNLWQVDGLGQNKKQLTTGGSAGSDVNQAIEPSLSLDGTKLVFQGNQTHVFVANPDAIQSTMQDLTVPSDDLPAMYPRISADGSEVTWTESFSSGSIQQYVQSPTPGAAYTFFHTSPSIGFAPGGVWQCSWNHQVRVGPDPGACTTSSPLVADDSADANASFGWRPVFSPDGKLLVTSIYDYPDFVNPIGIFLFDATTGALIRQLTNVSGDDMPVFSPDGTEILFNRGSDIYEVPTAGGPATLFVSGGNDPTWAN